VGSYIPAFIPQKSQEPLLSSFDIEGVAKYITEAPACRIVVMCGAGISTSAGIPDFRTPGSGLYNNLQKYNVPTPEAMFSLDYFRQSPGAFYELAKDLWPGTYLPTPCHYFIRLLHENGKLLRCYSQNIDGLELQAGLPPEKLVAAHGSFDGAHVIDTSPRVTVPSEELRVAIGSGPLGLHDLNSRKGGLVKPNIVFFGEPLPECFLNLHVRDFAECDLLLVLGTSLAVMPFCGLLAKANPQAPRLLINRELVGLCNELPGGFQFHLQTEGLNWRDAFYAGDVDDGVRAIAAALGWTSDMERLTVSQNPK
jgi:NAD-dependent deacetylase sirtuin 2